MMELSGAPRAHLAETADPRFTSGIVLRDAAKTAELLVDARRPARLVVSGILGCLFLFAAVVAISLAAGKSAPHPKPRRKPIPVTLVDAPPPPPPPPAPAPPQSPAQAEPAPAPMPHFQQAPQGPPSNDHEPAGDGQGPPGEPGGSDPYGGYSPPPPPAAPPPPPPRPPPPPAPKGPIRVTEDVTPPEPISMSTPPYPESAKSAGIEGTVVIKYVVTETGAVTSVEALKGPPELSGICIATVSGWRFKPAIANGVPVSVVRQARFPFRIRT